MNQLKTLEVTENVSEIFKVNGSFATVRVVTAGSAKITVETSLDGTNFSTVDDIAYTVEGEKTFNLCDFTPGQFARIVADAFLETVKILG